MKTIDCIHFKVDKCVVCTGVETCDEYKPNKKAISDYSNLFRSLLFSAGHKLKYITKAFTTKADVIVLDLEDAVPMDKKPLAREIISKYLAELDDNRPIYIRMNPVESGLTLLDLEVLISKINGIIYPMVNNANDIIIIDALLSLKEKMLKLNDNHFNIIVLIEKPSAILNIKGIASASKRINGLLFGSEDFLAETDGNPGINEIGIHIPRHLVLMAAKSLGIAAIDAPYVKVGDVIGLAKHINRAKVLGYDGMLVMSPNGVDMVNKFYTPTEDEGKEANKILELYEKNKEVGIYDGLFVSPPSVKAAKKIVKKMNN